ncbi:MAG: hypothetical protein WCA21_15165 [Terracidiphilus sp.]
MLSGSFRVHSFAMAVLLAAAASGAHIVARANYWREATAVGPDAR